MHGQRVFLLTEDFKEGLSENVVQNVLSTVQAHTEGNSRPRVPQTALLDPTAPRELAVTHRICLTGISPTGGGREGGWVKQERVSARKQQP